MTKEDYDIHKEAIMAIPHEKVTHPVMPVSVVAQMAENLAVWAKDDTEVLAKSGLNMLLVEELPTRSGALRHVQAKWVSDKNTRSDKIKEWNIEAPKGFELQTVLGHNMRFAFNLHPDLLKRVDEIAENSGADDMIQDLVDYATLGRDNIGLLEQAGTDITLPDAAETMAENLSELRAYSNNDKGQSNELKEERDRAYTHLYAAIREIHRVGQFVFWRNEERKKGYVNNYN